MNSLDPELLPISSDEQFIPGSMPELFKLVEESASVLKGMQRRMVSRVGLTPAQFVVLGSLWERDPQPPKDLAAAAFCTPGTITGIVDVLERKGLVSREPNPADRRSLLVTLTAEGRAMEAEAPNPDEMFGDCCAGMSGDELFQLRALLEKFNDSISSWKETR